MGPLFPIFLNLEGKDCLVIGGGPVAYRKITNLLEHLAKVTVISPQVYEPIKALAVNGSMTFRQKSFSDEDIQDMYLVIAATDDPFLNKKAADLCRQKGIMINVVDDPPNCDFFVPSVVRRNSLVVAVSTEGKSPLFARLLRQDLETLITDDYGDLVEFLGEKRDGIKKNVADPEKRQHILRALIDEEAMTLLKQGEVEKIRERIEQCISSWQD